MGEVIDKETGEVISLSDARYCCIGEDGIEGGVVRPFVKFFYREMPCQVYTQKEMMMLCAVMEVSHVTKWYGHNVTAFRAGRVLCEVYGLMWGEPLSAQACNNRVRRLVKKGLCEVIERGVYSLNEKVFSKAGYYEKGYDGLRKGKASTSAYNVSRGKDGNISVGRAKVYDLIDDNIKTNNEIRREALAQAREEAKEKLHDMRQKDKQRRWQRRNYGA